MLPSLKKHLPYCDIATSFYGFKTIDNVVHKANITNSSLLTAGNHNSVININSNSNSNEVLLTCGTTYKAQFVWQDAAGNSVTSSEITNISFDKKKYYAEYYENHCDYLRLRQKLRYYKGKPEYDSILYSLEILNPDVFNLIKRTNKTQKKNNPPSNKYDSDKEYIIVFE